MNKHISDAIEKYGTTRESLIPVMQHLISQENWLSGEVLKEIADLFGISHAEAYGTASFYSFINTDPCGKYVIRLCKTISCDMSGKGAILERLKSLLRIEVGETTHDGIFTLQQTNCLGWCHRGPAMLVNDDVYTELTPDKAELIIKGYADSERLFCRI
jgi:NADH-quinone oxidoreductase subunit E